MGLRLGARPGDNTPPLPLPAAHDVTAGVTPTPGRRWRRLLLLYIASGAALLGGATCNGCPTDQPRGDATMCGKCTTAADCTRGLTCLAGVCETAPPSCHVKIGL